MEPRASEPHGLLLRTGGGARYRFDPGALWLELLVTGGPGWMSRWEVLDTPQALADWTAESRLTPTPALRLTDADVTAARELRDALWRLAEARVDGEPAAPRDLATVNETAATPPLAPVLTAAATRDWAAGATGAHLLSTVARDAVEGLTGPYRDRLRRCAGERCYLLYVDTSRPGSRRWCAMGNCGNRHKVRTLRARRSTEQG